eukprot:1042044-Pleurochrysis_carterae.AAC.3
MADEFDRSAAEHSSSPCTSLSFRFLAAVFASTSVAVEAVALGAEAALAVETASLLRVAFRPRLLLSRAQRAPESARTQPLTAAATEAGNNPSSSASARAAISS